MNQPPHDTFASWPDSSDGMAQTSRSISGIFQFEGGVDSAMPNNVAALTGVELANRIFPIIELQIVYMEDMIVFNIDTDGVSIASGLRWGLSHAFTIRDRAREILVTFIPLL
jgi:hypothetical protein